MLRPNGDCSNTDPLRTNQKKDRHFLETDQSNFIVSQVKKQKGNKKNLVNSTNFSQLSCTQTFFVKSSNSIVCLQKESVCDCKESEFNCPGYFCFGFFLSPFFFHFLDRVCFLQTWLSIQAKLCQRFDKVMMWICEGMWVGGVCSVVLQVGPAESEHGFSSNVYSL